MTGPKFELSFIAVLPSERWAIQTALKPSTIVSANKRRDKLLKLGMEYTLGTLVIRHVLTIFGSGHSNSRKLRQASSFLVIAEIVLLHQALYIARPIQRCYISIS